jgi:hypothetical protein
VRAAVNSTRSMPNASARAASRVITASVNSTGGSAFRGATVFHCDGRSPQGRKLHLPTTHLVPATASTPVRKHSGGQTGPTRSLPVVKRSVWASDRSLVEASDSPAGEPIGYPNDNRPTAVTEPKPVSTGAFMLQLPFGFFAKTPTKPVFARMVPVIPWYAPVPLPFTIGAGPEP